MKKVIIISILSFITVYGFVQTPIGPVNLNQKACMTDPDMPANAVPVWPKSAYTPTGDPSCAPCYEYTNKRGTVIMECPFLIFPSQPSSDLLPATSDITTTDLDGSMDVIAPNTYTGNYPACSKKLYPPRTTPVWPKSAYTPTGNPDCAPCYEYTSKRGIAVMECPYLQFPSEREKNK